VDDKNNDNEDREDAPPGEEPRVLNAEELFAGKREVWIELDGVRYRLRITRRGKLILQK
jgi:hemin uptake protein HemP